MHKAIRFMVLAIGVLTTAAAPSHAQLEGIEPDNAFLVSGSLVDESVEFAFFMEEHAVVDGFRKLMSAADCKVAFSLSAVGVSELGGLTEVFFESVELSPGDLQEIKVPFALLGSGHALIEFNNIHRTGPCATFASGRLVGQGGETKAAVAMPAYQTYAARVRFNEGVHADAILLSGDLATESLEFAYYLKEFAVVDGVRRHMSAPECEVTFTARAKGVTDSGEVGEIVEHVALSPGDLREIKLPFAALGSSQALIESTDVRRTGPCDLSVTGRLVDTSTGVSRGSVGQFEHIPGVIIIDGRFQ